MQLLSEATTRHAIRRLFAAYLIISGIALAFPYRPATWLPLTVLHLFGIIILLQVQPYPVLLAWLTRRWPAGVRVIGDWYGLALIPALYTELAVLNVAVFNGRYFDSLVLGWEHALFGGQPSRDLAQTMPFLPLSELLHFSYISYYLIIYGPPLYLYLRGRRAAHQQLVFTLMLTFFAHYLFFIYFPVQGPRYIFPAPGGEIASGFFYNLTHRILEAGSSQGAAFPSSHVGVSFAQAALAFSLLPRVAPLVLLLSTGLAVGAVYGGFHYAIDALCGLAFGLLLFALAPRVARWFGAGPGS
jgi:membrane-associated phospholipid phosphatase